MSIKISHSAKELFLKSPRAYLYHYLLNIRQKTAQSALFFGNIIETALDVMYKGGTLEQAQETFRKNFRIVNYNGVDEDMQTSENIKFLKSDWDADLFTEKELKDLEGKTEQFKSWESLRRKGELMIQAYYNEIFPQIKKVISTQETFSIKSDGGDEITGAADLICELKDDRLILADNKTSSSSYPQDAILKESHGKQLALYYNVLTEKYPLDGAGYFVMEKKIRKREPKTRTQIIIDTPPDILIENTLAEFDNTIKEIKQGNFPCCAPQCDAYGQKCPYKSYCTNGDDMTGLTKLDFKRERK